MAKKKKKSVLEYDPLAWLKESDSSEVEAPEIKPTAKKSAAKKELKKTVKKAAKKATKKAVKKPVKKEAKKVLKKSVKKVAKKTVEKKVKNKPVEDLIDDTESEGFGLFAEESKVSKVEEPSSDDGFGFFTDEPASSTAEDTSTEDGFGFFTEDDNDALEEKNMETLDISKNDAINLGSELTIKTVTEVKGKINAVITAHEEIVINADEVIKIDTAGLQLLYSLKETLSQTGHHIKWIGTSTVINDSAEMIGMPLLAPKSKDACFGFFEENMPPKDADDGSSGFF